jgi:hypothetical protein
MAYYETSAKTDFGVTDVFQKIAELVLANELAKEQQLRP